jgi:ADP-ribose pyrophosphatase YjhB (NUDIX family)
MTNAPHRPDADPRFEITGRGLVVYKNAILLVSHGDYWYTPGGRAAAGESLPACVKREVWEETGLQTEVGSLLHVGEFFERSRNRHKVEFYFRCEVGSSMLPDGWKDVGGDVSERRFFSLDELTDQVDFQPRFLAQGTWLRERAQPEIYMGFESR